MKIELTDREVRRIVPILRTQYHKSYNLWEIAEIKGVLQKLGETVAGRILQRIYGSKNESEIC